MKQHTDPSITEDHWYISVPSDWSERPIHTFGTNNKRKNEGLREKNLLSLSYGNLVRRDIEDATGLTPASYETYQIVDPGDVVVRLLDLQNDKNSLRSGLVTETGIVTSAYVGLKINKEVGNPRFVAYSLRALDHQKYLYALGGGVRQSLNFDDFSKIKLPIPSLEEQSRIADFLDVETEEIDRVVGVLDELIEDLEARADAVVRETFQSLDDFKVSLSSVTRFVGGSGFPPKYQGKEDGDLQFLKVSSFSYKDEMGNIDDPRNMISFSEASELHASVITSDSILMAKVGEAMRLGRYERNKVDACIDNNMMALHPNEGILDGDFLQYSLETVEIDLFINPGPVPSLNVAAMKNFRIPLPSTEGQRSVVDHLDKETKRIDTMKSNAIELREELLARRKALITEYVTGQKRVE